MVVIMIISNNNNVGDNCINIDDYCFVCLVINLYIREREK